MTAARPLLLVAVLLLAAAMPRCGGSKSPADATAADTAGELPFADGGTDRLPEPTCGDGLCAAGENCLHCPADCECACGDGACSFGEFCAVCPADCDCERLAATPPMGWNSWNLFACDIDEELIRGIADAMVDSGMAAAGYRYVNLDDCWQVGRAADGTIIEDPETFPSGIPALADYVHDKGLKFGLYTCAGTLTCEERPGSYDHEAIDAQTYADWEVDLVKVDWCFTDGLDAKERYGIFRDAIDGTGREILLSICNWGFDEPWVWGPVTGEMWRTSADIKDNMVSVIFNLLAVEPTAPFARVGHWNDPDMLEVGNGNLTDAQYRAHFSLWAILAAPLLAGNDIRDMTDETRAILLNEEVIAVDQDPAGLQGVLLHENGPVRVYGRPLTRDGLRAVVLFNADLDEAAKGSVTWAELGLQEGAARVRDPWQHKDLGEYQNGFFADIPPSEAVMVLVDGTEPLPGPGEVKLGDQPWKYMANWDGPARRNVNADGGSLRLAGETHTSGIGVRGAAKLAFHLGHRCTRLDALAGLDDDAGPEGSVTFEVLADGEPLFVSDVVRTGDAPLAISVDLTGRRELLLVVTPAADQLKDDLADWADAVLTCN